MTISGLSSEQLNSGHGTKRSETVKAASQNFCEAAHLTQQSNPAQLRDLAEIWLQADCELNQKRKEAIESKIENQLASCSPEEATYLARTLIPILGPLEKFR